MEDNPLDGVDKWDIFRYFLGNWSGTGKGKPGESSTEKSYSLILTNQFIEIKSRSDYAPQEKNPSGEIYMELGLLSFDKERSKYVLREFHVEGFVNQYVLEQDRFDGRIYKFITESMENIPSNWRARTTIEILSKDKFREIFDLAEPGEDWDCYITSEFQRLAELGDISLE